MFPATVIWRFTQCREGLGSPSSSSRLTHTSLTSCLPLFINRPLPPSTFPHLISLTMAFTGSDICKILFAILLPPVGVFLERGCNVDFLINILLTILGYIPGIIHALYIILKY
ncbi:hypothetical protein BD310DRAFT_20642 [Dichomitus squalens]|uniref:Uncharacterized protein n=2 Tax=Dichomitus squalens TaxID=114155 RepID=A0A4Q9QDC9_9APHY|nr:hypothetical protein BD310DRAFT_20642 [Dichomitus squalens]